MSPQVMLMGIIVMAFLIGDLSNIMSNLDPVANEFKQTLDNLNDYMHRSGFDNDLRLKLREYIMLSEPCFRDHFNKEMLTKLSPTLISVVARKKMGHVVEKIPFYAHTVQRTGGYPKGQRVLVHDREWEHNDEEEPSVGRPALVLRSPSLLRYDVQFDDGAPAASHRGFFFDRNAPRRRGPKERQTHSYRTSTVTARFATS
jgi:hypothetical protein